MTGTPKIRAAELIAQWEPLSRGVYCGAIGIAGPEHADLSVAIRTVEIDADGQMRLGSRWRNHHRLRRGPRMAGMLGQGGCHRRRTADTAVARYRRAMKVYECKVCGNRLYFENSVCVGCGTYLGFRARTTTSCRSDSHGVYVDARGTQQHVPQPRPVGVHLAHRGRRRPMQRLRDDPHPSQRRRREGDRGVPVAERAKRQLLAELDRLGFVVADRATDPERGLCFDMLSSVDENVVIGHADGVITIDLAEADDAHREQVRDRLDDRTARCSGTCATSPATTEWILVDGTDRQERCRELFGDDTVSYQDAIDRHYRAGPAGRLGGVLHLHLRNDAPVRDFAETWAHYLHICDTVESAVATGLIVTPTDDVRTPFSRLVTTVWSPPSLSLNLINRSMGDDDLYPFVIPRRCWTSWILSPVCARPDPLSHGLRRPRRRVPLRGPGRPATCAHASFEAHPLLDERRHLVHQVFDDRFGCDGGRQHDGDLAAHAVGRPGGHLGEGAAPDLLVGLGELAADGDATVRAEHVDGVGEGVGQAMG